jgi:hypothetical protein
MLSFNVAQVEENRIADGGKYAEGDHKRPLPWMSLRVFIEEGKEDEDNCHKNLCEDAENLWGPCAYEGEIFRQLDSMGAGE